MRVVGRRLVAVPPVTAYCTVTVWPEAALSVTARFTDVVASAPLELVAANCTVGVASLS